MVSLREHQYGAFLSNTSVKKNFLKIFLYILRSLIYIKRGIIYVSQKLISVFVRGHALYRRTLGFYLYKLFFIIKKRFLKKANISQETRFIDFFGQRWTLQAIVFVMAVVVMIPHSKLYTQSTENIPGRETLLYKLVGPGQQDFNIDVEEVNVQALAQKDTRSWKEGAVLSDNTQGSGAAVSGPQEIAGLSAGGTALNKPIILPGAQVSPTTTNESGRTEVIYHTVLPGEVVGRIAQNYGLSVLTVLWANNLTSRSYIRPGDKLKILPMDGVEHTVKKGDTINKIASAYDAKVADIVKFNKLQEGGEDIVIGETLMIPNGEKPAPVYVAPTRSKSFNSIVAPAPSVDAPAGSRYIWPTSARRITQYYGWRHTGLDIAGPIGTPLYAARAGTVIKSQCGWNGGYGCYVILDHGGGVKTLYGHASELFVSVGDEVAQGQTIAAMGSTGRSTGSHIHFEVRIGSSRVNPLQYIR